MFMKARQQLLWQADMIRPKFRLYDESSRDCCCSGSLAILFFSKSEFSRIHLNLGLRILSKLGNYRSAGGDYLVQELGSG